MSFVMGIGSLVLFGFALFVAVPLLLSLVMVVPIAMRLHHDHARRHAVLAVELPDEDDADEPEPVAAEARRAIWARAA